ncbi:DUF883 family protein [Sinorhizobium psoraleae]|uniref:DUF883 family protein n=1 Tax=Sinorhizobium psoraleae TaxID=520838 RepID=A0ABT4KJ20_9HYPH|nr:DUF883 family protein [Sinorhizobium psoraleae]MCZ4091843.1 DUF883 family protein [Sinorhizobium psoraleae]NRP70149.1 hypothetical protein [Sinorhizobium psoraleae]
MATGLFSSSSTRKRNGGHGESPIEDQLHEIREDIAALVGLLSERGAAVSHDAKAKAMGARDRAEADLENLLASGEQLLSDLRDRYSGTEREIRRAVREHPIATLGAAAAIGLIAAALLRR